MLQRSPSKRKDHSSAVKSVVLLPTVTRTAFHGPFRRANSAAVALSGGSAGRAGPSRGNVNRAASGRMAGLGAVGHGSTPSRSGVATGVKRPHRPGSD